MWWLRADATELDREPRPIGVLDPLLFTVPRFGRPELLNNGRKNVVKIEQNKNATKSDPTPVDVLVKFDMTTLIHF